VGETRLEGLGWWYGIPTYLPTGKDPWMCCAAYTGVRGRWRLFYVVPWPWWWDEGHDLILRVGFCVRLSGVSVSCWRCRKGPRMMFVLRGVGGLAGMFAVGRRRVEVCFSGEIFSGTCELEL
jgi:hypothetical protein